MKKKTEISLDITLDRIGVAIQLAGFELEKVIASKECIGNARLYRIALGLNHLNKNLKSLRSEYGLEE